MEQQLTDYLLKKYSPIAILLHGSRTNGYAREHSDWDFAIIVDKDTEGEREIVGGANIEIQVLKLPFREEDIEKKWLALRNGNVKIMHDPQNICPDIIEKVSEYYAKPMAWTPAEILGHKAQYR